MAKQIFITPSDHERIFAPLISRSTAYREMQILRSAKNWKNRRFPTLSEYCDFFDLDIDFVSAVLGLKN